MTPVENLNWLKGIYTNLIRRTTLEKKLTEEEEEAFNQLEKELERLETLEQYLIKWQQQLKIDGVNSKSMVRNDIEFLLKKD